MDSLDRKIKTLETKRDQIEKTLYGLYQDKKKSDEEKEALELQKTHEAGIKFCKSLLGKYVTWGNKLIQHHSWAPDGKVFYDYDSVDILYIYRITYHDEHHVYLDYLEMYAGNGERNISHGHTLRTLDYLTGKYKPSQTDYYLGGLRVISDAELQKAIYFYKNAHLKEPLPDFIAASNTYSPEFSAALDGVNENFKRKEFDSWADKYVSASKNLESVKQDCPKKYRWLIETLLENERLSHSL